MDEILEYRPIEIPDYDHTGSEGNTEKDNDGTGGSAEDEALGQFWLAKIPAEEFSAKVDKVEDGYIYFKDYSGTYSTEYQSALFTGYEFGVEIKGEVIFVNTDTVNKAFIQKRSVYGTEEVEILENDIVYFYTLTTNVGIDGTFNARKVNIGDGDTYFRFDTLNGAKFKGDFSVSGDSTFTGEVEVFDNNGLTVYDGSDESTSLNKASMTSGSLSFEERLLTTDSWFATTVVKKNQFGTAEDGDIVDLRIYTNNIPWENVKMVAIPSQVSLTGGSLISMEADAIPLGDNQYQIKIRTVSGTLSSYTTSSTYAATYVPNPDSGKFFIHNDTILVARALLIQGFLTYSGGNIIRNAYLKIELRETPSGGPTGSWYTVFYDEYGSSAGDNPNIQKTYDVDTQVEVKISVATGRKQVGSDEHSILDTVNIPIKYATTFTEVIEGGTAAWFASEI